jgi:Tol biopolymer transport system component
MQEPLAVGADVVWSYFGISPPSISRDGHRLAYVQSFGDANIWRIEVPSSAGRANPPTSLISSTQCEWGPQFSPDGKRIVFESIRSGPDELWLCESDGTNPTQLTFHGASTPRWSPDGRHIAFVSRPEGHEDISVMSAEGGSPRRLTTDPANDEVPSWSRDGHWIYFSSNRSGTRQVWKVPAEGGQAVQVTKQGGYAAFESPDGQVLYYAKLESAGLWRMPVEGGEESLVLDQLQAGYWGAWAVADKGIYFINPEAKPRATIEFFSFATRRITRIAVLEREPVNWFSNLAISPDGRWILYTQLDQDGNDIMLVENFQ